MDRFNYKYWLIDLLMSDFFFAVLLPGPSRARGRLEVPGRRRDPRDEAPRQGRGVLQEEGRRREDPPAGQEGRKGRQEDRALPEGHRKLRIRVKMANWRWCGCLLGGIKI